MTDIRRLRLLAQLDQHNADRAALWEETHRLRDLVTETLRAQDRAITRLYEHIAAVDPIDTLWGRF